MLETTWNGGSLRARVAVAIATAVLPLAISAVVGYFLLSHGVIDAYRHVAQTQSSKIDPAQRLQIDLLEAEDQISEYLVTGDLAFRKSYRADREAVEADFAQLHREFAPDTEERMLVERAYSDWTAANLLGTELIAARQRSGGADIAASAEKAEKYDALLHSAIDKLRALNDTLSKDNTSDYFAAHLAYERSEWIAGIAAMISFVLMLAGISMFGRLMKASVDRLVEGASRFAAGDREHRIEIQVPPELKTVATEFNRMIERIHESENALADQASRDALTGLQNRRAFDEAIAEAFERMERLDERIAVLMIDLDHFKKVNDTYGHGVGDGVLRETVKIVNGSLRKIDRAYRFGGEEFVVVLPGADSVAAQAVAERMRANLAEKPLNVGGEMIPMTMSVGIATTASPYPGRISTLMKAADEALYKAKNSGRNSVVLYEDEEFDAIRGQLTPNKAAS